VPFGDVEPEQQDAVPAIVMVASGMQPAALVLPANAELGRKIAAAGATHEIADERMSRDHATVRRDRGTWVIVDLDSRNGTFVNGERAVARDEIRRRGDVVVRLGHTVFLLLADGRGHPAPDQDLVVVGPELARAHDRIRRAAHVDTLLVEGEPGSGKELAARLFHASGPRKAGPFVAVNCAAIPEGVADRLLFGGKKGAAIETIGQLQLAHGGTLFLDNVDDLSATAQATLWRLLDAGGATSAVAIVAGGHRLRAAVAERTFRDDLYGRFARAAVQLPPLRDRLVDIARLVRLELAQAAVASHPLAPHPKLIESCCLRPWPGNIRELRASIRRAAGAAIDAGRDLVRLDDLPETAGMPPGTSSGETAVERKSDAPLGKAAIAVAMKRANGVVSVAARALGVHRSQLYRLLEQHAIAYEE
jgi:DNA-binding NtrC family response regulator